MMPHLALNLYKVDAKWLNHLINPILNLNLKVTKIFCLGRDRVYSHLERSVLLLELKAYFLQLSLHSTPISLVFR